MFVEVKKCAVIVSPEDEAALLLLKDEKSDVALPIEIDLFRGRIISDLMKRVPGKRPVAYDLIGKILSECGAKLTRVVISDRKGGFYSALINIEAHDKKIQLECRPSDAVALAICDRVPIFVSEKLLSVRYVIKMKPEGVDPLEKWLRNLNFDFFKHKM